MCLNMYVFCTDERQRYLSQSLYGIKKSPDESMKRQSDYNVWVLPTPLYKYDIAILNERFQKEIVTGSNIAFAGAVNETWRDYFCENNIEFIDFMQSEKVSLANAEVTAEATLMLYIANSKLCVCGQKIIVSGYGRCGRLIAEKFAALGAKVTVMARNKAARKQAVSDGHNAVTFSYGPQEAYGTAALINTVPSPVISDLILSELHKECLLIEIASAPGGFDMEAVNKNHLRYVEAPGLPSKYLQKSGGRIIADYINRFVKTRFENGVGSVWIYQVSP